MSRIPFALVVCCLVRYDSALLSAECAGIRVGDEKKRAATVLEVTVSKVATTGYGRESAAAVSVHRVWKGEVSKVATVYFVPGLDLQLKEGARYVIFASPQTDDARR